MKYKHLTHAERYYIWQRLSNLDSLTKIASDLGVHKSTVSREVKRNSLSFSYHPIIAHQMAVKRREVAKTKFSKLTDKVKQYIHDKLILTWSPEQIAGRMPKSIKVSHEAIYQYIRYDRKHKGMLYKLLPHKGKKYNYHGNKHSPILNWIDISLRPKIVDTKSRIGDYEIDTIIGKRFGSKQCLFTMVDRKSKFTFIRKLKNTTAITIQNALEDIYDNTMVPIKTLTSDNGHEFANHQLIAQNISCGFYFARPYRSADRGLNEHTNGLIRRFLPKGTDFAKITCDTISNVQHLLNHRPRKSLGFLTPHEVMTRYLKRTYPDFDVALLI